MSINYNTIIAKYSCEKRIKTTTGRFKGFTLAEVLITLAIIGVVAALTIPNLIVDFQKKQAVVKLKKVNSVLSQMILKSFSDNGAASGFLPADKELNEDDTKEFFSTYWLPYFNSPIVSKDNEIPYSDRYPYKLPSGSDYEFSVQTNYSAGRVYFTTADNTGYFVSIMYWDYDVDDNGNIVSETARYSKEQTIYVDINGVNEPNTFGKDIFLFTADFNNNTVKTYCADKDSEYINRDCSKTGTGFCCSTKMANDGWIMDDDYPW